MMEKISEQTGSAVKMPPNSPVCEVAAFFVGCDSAAIDSAKEMLISAYVKSMINKGKTGDI